MLLSLLKFIGRPLFLVLFSVEYHGLDNIPESGPIIIAGNHPTYLDPILIMLRVNRVVSYMAWDGLFSIPILGQLIKALGAFPVDIRKGKGDAAYHQAKRILENGSALGIFPEGHRSDHGPMDELKAGTARLALETGAAIVPVTIGGASRAWPKFKLLPKPAKIIVRFHKPLVIDENERALRRDDRTYHRQVMQQLAERINRSLTPEIRGFQQIERWYQQPASPIRSYELAPLFASLIASFVVARHHAFRANWLAIWLPSILYYGYLFADLFLIKQFRTVKWLRNSMPVWLILCWHYPLTAALGVPAGEMNEVLTLAVLAAFFAFFWADYFTVQKFIRGLVVCYYISLALELRWPHPLATMLTILSFVIVFSLRYQTLYYWATVGVMTILGVVAIWLSDAPAAPKVLLIYVGLGLATLLYLQTFLTVAYDIRKAGNVSLQHSRGIAR